MFSLKPLLARYSRTARTIQGGADDLQKVPPPPKPVLDKEQFQTDLQALRRTNTIAIVMLASVIVVAFVITLFFIHRFISNATAVASLFVGFGGLTGGITTAILGAFRVKAQSDLLAILSKNVDSMSLQTVIDVLSKRA